MARELGVSRNAVWKAINSLRKEGHEISGGSGIGYTLSEESDLLSEAGIGGHLREKTDLLVFETIDSTNNEAKRLAIGSPKAPLLIVSGEQTQGRGRLGRTFYSPADTGLYMSFLLKPAIKMSEASFLTIAASVAVTKAIENVTGISCGIKWVNDIYVGDKKVCGILTEAVAGIESGNLDYVIVGIGVNCHPASFPPEAGSNPGFIKEGTPRNLLAAEIANEFLPLVESMDKESILDYYRDHCIVIGKSIRIFKQGAGEQAEDGAIATAIGIDDSGRLIVKYPDGNTSHLSSGEISVREART